jgi:hypothetical protein
MVLGGGVKKAIAALAALTGALSCWFLTFVAFALASGSNTYSPDESYRLIGVFLLVSPVALGLGAWLGVHLHRRWRRGVHKHKAV